MIPKNNDDLTNDFEIQGYASKTYYLDIEKNRIVGTCDDIVALKQTIYSILNTERFDYLIYSWNYGVEFKELIGENETYVIPEIERVIKEALIQDDRITGVNNFDFKKDKNSVIATFNVVSTLGEITVDKVVNV